jgi:hypothetical protein
MVANVSYQGIAIVKGASARDSDAEGTFILCDCPMPVGTQLEVQLEREGARPARVVHVVEGEGAGMGVRFTGAVVQPTTTATTATPMSTTEATPTPTATPTTPTASPARPPSGRDRRKRRR